MASRHGAPDGARAAFDREWREATRSTSILVGSLGVVIAFAWSLLDRALEPAHAASFLVLRVGVAATGTAIILLVALRLVRGIALDWASFALFAVLQVAIAWMLPRVDSFETYLLGFSLPLYASGIAVTWRWQFTALLAPTSIAALALFGMLEPSALDARRAIIAGFYLGTASVVAIVAQYLRQQGAWREFQIREALAEEQRHNEVLLADLARLSREDELTGLVNRRGWQEIVESAFTARHRRGGHLAIVLCDLDHFKRINDEHGHAAGDEVLRRVATMLQGVVRSSDTVARLGGDEFGIVIPDGDREVAAAIAVRIVTSARDLALRDLGVPTITTSVGVAILDDRDDDIDALVHRADAEMYRAKAERDAAWMAGLRRDGVEDELAGMTP